MPRIAPEKRREYNQTYYRANRESLLARAKIRSPAAKKQQADRLAARYSACSVEAHLCAAARSRARKKGIPFAIGPADITIPGLCPVLGVALETTWGGGEKPGPRPNAPTLDRVVPELGYVRGNVRVISFRANRLRCDASVDEMRAVLAYMEALPNDAELTLPPSRP